MTTECMNYCDNVYRRCRLDAAKYNPTLFSLKETALILNVSEHTLSNYERGATKSVPADIIMHMADLYNAPEIPAYFCKQDCPIGKTLNIATEIKSIEGSTLRLLNEMNLDEIRSTLLTLVAVAADGRIDESEKDKFADAMKELRDIRFAIDELDLISKKILKEQK